MMRDFSISDLQRFDPNEKSGVTDVLEDLRADDWSKYTQERDGVIRSITSFKEVTPDEWAIYCLIAKTFSAVDSAELKKGLLRVVAVLNPRELWTISREDHRWHRWFGFTEAGPVELNGKTYTKWSMTWARKPHFS